MLGFSTAWMSDRVRDGNEFIEVLQGLGIKFLELEYRIPESLFLNVKPEFKSKNFKIVSIHNFFPFPEQYSHLKPSGDLFPLSSLDKEEREKAVKFTVKTIQTSHDLECSSVVLHLGKVGMDSYYKEFCHYFDSDLIESPEMDLFLARVKDERQSKRQRFLDAVFFSLEKLNREAEKQNICLGVENRYYFHEIPNCEEIGMILRKFAGSKIFYWHDVGHGHVQERLRMQSHQELLKTYAPYILGAHLHDANGYTDHESPGKGEVDFGWIKGYLKDETVKILEIHPRVSFEEIQKGFLFLRNLGYK
ncbi:MAG: sugar phosphate isomerase/epimerase [Deltaproteobacteria bacterium]|nr:sugar phosphate isomerase/epimerase [Deltaproteobacteria bacterium]